MEVIIEIENERVEARSVPTSNGNFMVYEQIGWVHIPGEKYPQKCKLQNSSEGNSHRVGRYRIADSSLIIDRFGNVQLKRVLDLVPDN